MVYIHGYKPVFLNSWHLTAVVLEEIGAVSLDVGPQLHHQEVGDGILAEEGIV